MGIGTLMMKNLMDFLDNNISPLPVVELMASKGKDPFYEKFGFTKRVSERRGHGLLRVWK
ncbi:MAG: GNAT family N-acetyltransferase [Candidatus Thorarchaeota archaeon]